MTIATAILALVISFASLGFSVYQYRILHRVRVAEKATALLRMTNDLRRKSEDLKHFIDGTDDVDDHAKFFLKINSFLEVQVNNLAISNKTSLNTLLEIERALPSLELEVDLLHKQVSEFAKFNAEVNEYKANALRDEA